MNNAAAQEPMDALATLLAPLAKILAVEVAKIMQAQPAAVPVVQGKRFYSVAEIAVELGISESTIYKMIYNGRVKYYQFGEQRKVLDLSEVLQACQRMNPSKEEKEAILVAGTRRRAGRPRGKVAARLDMLK